MHHTLIHQKQDSNASKQHSDGWTGPHPSDVKPIQASYCSLKQHFDTQVLMATVNIQDVWGRLHKCRCLLESASQVHFIRGHGKYTKHAENMETHFFKWNQQCEFKW